MLPSSILQALLQIGSILKGESLPFLEGSVQQGWCQTSLLADLALGYIAISNSYRILHSTGCTESDAVGVFKRWLSTGECKESQPLKLGLA